MGAAAGTYVNTTSVITASVDAETLTGNPASDSFGVLSAPVLSKEFTDDPATPGGTVTLEYTISYEWKSGDLPLAAMYQGARSLRIADGPDEVHKILIAKNVMKQHHAGEGWDFGN